MATISACTICQDEEECIVWYLNCCKFIFDQLGEQFREVIIVDGGSRDSTVDVIHSYQDQLPLVFIEHRFDSFGQQKNRALEKATGSHILGMDADMTVGSNFTDRVRSGFYDDRYWTDFTLFAPVRGNPPTRCLKKIFPTMRLWKRGPRFVTNFHEKLDGQPPGYRVDVEVPMFHNCFRISDEALMQRGERKQQYAQELTDAGAGPGPADRYYRMALGEANPMPEHITRLIIPGC